MSEQTSPLHHDPATVPAIALSAAAAESDIEASMAAGYQQHLVKPVNPARLVREVSELCRQPRVRPEHTPAG